MKRVLLDTNIYGRIVERKEQDEVRQLSEKRPNILIYGFDVVRKELRQISKETRIRKNQLRMVVLTLYDSLIRAHDYSTTNAIRQLAEDYYQAYKKLGGRRTEKEITNDFLIIACASIHEMDIVASEDNKTMFSQQAIKAYEIVNILRKYKTPEFISYEIFRRLFS